MYEGFVENDQISSTEKMVASDDVPPPPAPPLINSPLCSFDNHHLPPQSWTLLLQEGLAGDDEDDQLSLGFSTKDLSSDQFSVKCNYNTGGVAKRAKIQHSSTKTSIIKVRKEKLGDKITALHSLVSPFGKTDTATVLLEAIGYIKFLEKQIQALSVPYMGCGSGKSTRQRHPRPSECDEEQKKDLRSRGLCLVPICCTLDIGSKNGADF